MKRLVPLWITALGGFVLIVAYFIPITQGWGEVAAIWFDILAAIAFILGGGNLLKIHLKKTSDRARGWGYSVITLLAFLAMLYCGLVKVGAPPAPQQEFYGETFAKLPVGSIPDSLVFYVPADMPERADGKPVHDSVALQFSHDNGRLLMRGWMTANQKAQLLEFSEGLAWQCAVERLYTASQPKDLLARKVAYYAQHQVLAYRGHMTDDARTALLALNGDDHWTTAVAQLHEKTQRTAAVTLPADLALPPYFDPQKPAADITFEQASRMLQVSGPMSPAQRNALADVFPVARPLEGERRQALLARLRDLGGFSNRQEEAFEKFADGTWRVDQLVEALNNAGTPQEVDKTACEMYEEQKAGAAVIEPKKTVGEKTLLNEQQIAALRAFADDPLMKVAALEASLESAGTLSDAQREALHAFLGAQPTAAQRDRDLAFALLKTRTPDNRAALNRAQVDLLLAPYRQQMRWRTTVGELYVAAHEVKFPWSGEYRAQGTPFWWLYEYAFKPLQATTFAMLAFYVASAAFRAFRAKNIEAMLLLSTAFIILLGRTAAGVYLTAWLPEELAGLKIDNLTVYIMSVFNTAGTRAIMIGVALGIASTSLKVLLGVDRSYLGSGD